MEIPGEFYGNSQRILISSAKFQKLKKNPQNTYVEEGIDGNYLVILQILQELS